MLARSLATLAVLTLLVAACASTATSVAERTVPQDQPGAASTEPVDSNAAPAPVPTVAPELATRSWADDYELGDCFNNLGTDDGDNSIAGPAIRCSVEHENEIFEIFDAPYGLDEPYPADQDAFFDSMFSKFCDPATIEFAGAPWDQIPVGIGAWVPSADEWAAGDRAIMCTAQAGLRDENLFKIGTAAGGTLRSGEGVVARATVDGQRDFYFSTERSDLVRLTDGEFDLGNTSPQVLETSFIFAAPAQDGSAPGAGAYGYELAEQRVSELFTGAQDDWEIDSVLFSATGADSYLFAARTPEANDWNLYRRTAADAGVRLTENDGDDRWPALAPNGSQVVFHSDGDIWIMNIDGTDKQQLTTDPGGDFESAVSPDGTQIVFASDRSGNDDIWIMNLDGSGQTNLTNHPANDAWPFWSADGSTIYFQTDRLGVRANIMIMQVDGSNQSYFSREFLTNGAVLNNEMSALLVELGADG